MAERGEDSATADTVCESFSGLGSTILEFFNKQRHNHDLCDCLLTVDGVDFPAHACVLGASSGRLLDRVMAVRCNSMSVLSLENVTYDGFYPIFEYMYTGILQFKTSRLQEVHACATTLGVTQICNFLEHYINQKDTCKSPEGSCNETLDTNKEIIDSGKDLVRPTSKELNPSCKPDKEHKSGGFEDCLNFFATLTANATPLPPVGSLQDKLEGDSDDCRHHEVRHVAQFGAGESHVSSDAGVISNNRDNSIPDDLQEGELQARPLRNPDVNQRPCALSDSSSQSDIYEGNLVGTATTGLVLTDTPSEIRERDTLPHVSENEKNSCSDSTTREKQSPSSDWHKLSDPNEECGKGTSKCFENDMNTTERGKNRVYIRCQKPVSIYTQKTDNKLGGLKIRNIHNRHRISQPIQKRKCSTPRKVCSYDSESVSSLGEQSSAGKGKTQKRRKNKESDVYIKPTLFNCSKCPRGFFTESALAKHCEGHDQGGIHKCHVCNRSYVRLCDFTRHVRSHGTLHCECCDFTTKLQRHFVEHNEKEHGSSKPFRCHFPDCNFVSGKLHDLDEHRLIHSEVKCFSCHLCGKTFAQKGGLYSHTKSCLQKRDFLCDICGRAFNHLGSMKSHRRIHVGDKPFQCSDCNASFSDHRNMKRHKRIHENIFPYACEYCDKRFRHSNSRKSHEDKQHMEEKLRKSTVGNLACLNPPENPFVVNSDFLTPPSMSTAMCELRGVDPQIFAGNIQLQSQFIQQLQPHQ